LGLSYRRFYERLLSFFLHSPGTVLGDILLRIHRLYREYLEDPDMPQVHLVASQEDMVGSLNEFGTRKGWSVADWAWLQVAKRFDTLMRELPKALPEFDAPHDDETATI